MKTDNFLFAEIKSGGILAGSYIMYTDTPNDMVGINKMDYARSAEIAEFYRVRGLKYYKLVYGPNQLKERKLTSLARD